MAKRVAISKTLLSELRESGSIAQAADLMLMIYRDEHHTPPPATEASAKRSRPNITMARLATQSCYLSPRAAAFATWLLQPGCFRCRLTPCSPRPRSTSNQSKDIIIAKLLKSLIMAANGS